MIQITTQPNKNTTDNQYKINTSFNSLQKYINNYEINECKSNIDVINNINCLTGCNYNTITLYGYQYGNCIPIGVLNGDHVTYCKNQVISTRTVGCLDGQICTSSCTTSKFCYCQDIFTSPGGTIYSVSYDGQINGGKCPVPLNCYYIPDPFLWPCIRDPEFSTWSSLTYANPVQLATNTWLCAGCSSATLYIVGRPVIPVGTTLLERDLTRNWYSYSSEVTYVAPGNPIVWCKGNTKLIDAFCAEFICVCTQSGGLMTLLEFNLRECGSHPNNYIIVNLPDIVTNSILEENSKKWVQERMGAGYTPYVCVPGIWAYDEKDGRGYWAYYQGKYIYCHYEFKYITTGCNNYDNDINQIVFKRG